VTLALIIVALVLLWPVPYLGYATRAATGVVTQVTPDSTAARAGIRPGDRIVRKFDYAWADLGTQRVLFPLAWSQVQEVPLLVERDGVLLDVTLPAEPPTHAYQLEKLGAFALGSLCWLTGWLLGLVRRHDLSHLRPFVWFWLVLGGVVGAYTFARYSSYPLALVAQWLLLTVLAPLAIAIHAWFPPRPMPPADRRRMMQLLIVGLCAAQAIFVGFIALWQPTVVALVTACGFALPVVFVLAFMGSGIVLWRAGRQTTIAHIHRQIRLIAAACVLVAAIWTVLRTAPAIVGLEPLLPHYAVDLVSGLVPLAYLISGAAPDLYRLERLVVRVTMHVLTLALLLAGFGVITTALAWHEPLGRLVIVVALAALYAPLNRLLIRLSGWSRTNRRDEVLIATTAQLTTTLDPRELATIICRGLHNAFARSPVACYLRDPDTPGNLTLAAVDSMHLPPCITTDVTDTILARLAPVTEARIVLDEASRRVLATEVNDLLYHPQIALWCQLRQDEQLLGLVVLGRRADLDPYRGEDVRAVYQLVSAAALAVTNSESYTRQVAAEIALRQLYHRLQHVQDRTAAAIARELHDEAINVNVRLNIAALERLLTEHDDPTLRAELTLLLEGERSLAELLRMICEQITPIGLDDPRGLPGVLRRQVEQVRGQWAGMCTLDILGQPQPVALTVQHEAFRFVREALTNAVKHSGGTAITVVLTYPEPGETVVRLRVRDNGRGIIDTDVAPDRLGLRHMREGARAVGGDLIMQRVLGGGTELVFRAPIAGDNDPHSGAA
jgi:signal transduction histidine kinase